MPDQRLPQPGHLVLLDVARVLRPLVASPRVRVVSRDGALVTLESDTEPMVLPTGTPVVLTTGVGRHHIEGLVSGHPSATSLTVTMRLPPDGREAPRAPSHLDVNLDVIGHEQDESLRGLTQDLSVGGLRLLVSQALDPGAPTFLTIEVPGHEPVLAIGEILGCQPHLFGEYDVRLRFTSISAEAYARLEAWCAHDLAVVAREDRRQRPPVAARRPAAERTRKPVSRGSTRTSAAPTASAGRATGTSRRPRQNGAAP